jgi:hypothetical protein
MVLLYLFLINVILPPFQKRDGVKKTHRLAKSMANNIANL